METKVLLTIFTIKKKLQKKKHNNNNIGFHKVISYQCRELCWGSLTHVILTSDSLWLPTKAYKNDMRLHVHFLAAAHGKLTPFGHALIYPVLGDLDSASLHGCGQIAVRLCTRCVVSSHIAGCKLWNWSDGPVLFQGFQPGLLGYVAGCLSVDHGM